MAIVVTGGSTEAPVFATSNTQLSTQWTKRQLIDAAFTELAMQGYVVDLDQEDITKAMNSMDAMLGVWEGKGIYLNYRMASSPEQTDPDQIAGVPAFANEPIYTNMALRLCSRYGKIASAELKMTARSAYRDLLAKCAAMPTIQYNSILPVGAGNKPYRGISGPEYFQPVTPLTTGGDSELDF